MVLSWPGGSFSAALELLALCGYYVIAADLVMLLWHVLRRMRQFILIDLLSALFALFPVLVHFPFCLGSSDENSQSLTIVSWNVDNFHLECLCLDDLSLKILNEDPDIICLQERPHQNLMSKATITSRFPDYPYVVYNEREDEVLNLMVLSKYPLNTARTFYFPGSYNKFMAVDVAVGDKSLRLYNVHLQTTSVSDNAASSFTDKLKLVIANAESRNKQADILSANIESYGEGNVIVCGDFNSPLFGYSCQTVAKGMNDASWSNSLTFFQSSFIDFLFLPKIDHFFYRGNLKCVGYELTEGEWTDHKMQRTDFKLRK